MPPPRPLSAPVHPSVTLWPPDETTRRDLHVCLHDRGANPAFADGQGGQIDYETARDGRRLIVVRAAASVTLGGTLDEPAWGAAPVAKD